MNMVCRRRLGAFQTMSSVSCENAGTSFLITYQAHLGPTVALGQGLRSWERGLPARGKLG